MQMQGGLAEYIAFTDTPLRAIERMAAIQGLSSRVSELEQEIVSLRRRPRPEDVSRSHRSSLRIINGLCHQAMWHPSDRKTANKIAESTDRTGHSVDKKTVKTFLNELNALGFGNWSRN